jgi:uncharacterized protein YbaA (DUF1428 family)
MIRTRLVILATASLLLLLASACGGEDEAPPETSAVSDAIEEVFEQFDPDNFDDSTNIDNQWFPLQPGTQWIYEGTTTEDDETFEHRIEFTVTDMTKEIEGVRTVVAWIEDFSDDELVEAEIAFYAQDNDGHVWFLGEYPEEYEDGELVSALTWIAGVRSARAGIAMMANPQLDMPSYAQGYGPEVHWSDRAQVVELGQETCVAFDCYLDVLITEEFNANEPNAFQLKYYAAGVGHVRVGWRGEDATQEELELVEYVQLDAEALLEVSTEALRLEKSAYQVSPRVYGHTEPIETTIILEAEFVPFDPNDYDNPTDITNEWLPLQPGTRWVFEGTTTEDDETSDHRIEFTVTDLTKEIAGVRTVVAWIEDFSDDELVEAEIAFYAQDNDGNVWFFGEYPEEYEDGKFVTAPTWIAGLKDALAGVKMRADPQLDTPAYFQGWGPVVEWTDYGQVDQMGEETCVAVDCYQDVLVIAESSLEEEDAYQLKYYARGVGNVRVGWRGEDATQEELELVSYTQLDQEALAEVRLAALAMEEHAYEISDVYGQTAPSQGP